MKKLSLTLPSAQSSTNSLLSTDSQRVEPKRRLSIVSLPAAVPATSLRRKGEEDQSLDSSPYQDGPVQILPGIWLGSEDNVRDWRGHRERGIKSILNVAKEVSTIFDAAKPHRAFMSTPDLGAGGEDTESTYYPAHFPSGRPAMHYLKLNWSHGQADLVHTGFPAAFTFVDRALERGDGVLIQYVTYEPSPLIGSLTFIVAVSVAFHVLQPWLLPWSCAQPRNDRQMCPARSGH